MTRNFCPLTLVLCFKLILTHQAVSSLRRGAHVTRVPFPLSLCTLSLFLLPRRRLQVYSICHRKPLLRLSPVPVVISAVFPLWIRFVWVFAIYGKFYRPRFLDWRNSSFAEEGKVSKILPTFVNSVTHVQFIFACHGGGLQLRHNCCLVSHESCNSSGDPSLYPLLLSRLPPSTKEILPSWVVLSITTNRVTRQRLLLEKTLLPPSRPSLGPQTHSLREDRLRQSSPRNCRLRCWLRPNQVTPREFAPVVVTAVLSSQKVKAAKCPTKSQSCLPEIRSPSSHQRTRRWTSTSLIMAGETFQVAVKVGLLTGLRNRPIMKSTIKIRSIRSWQMVSCPHIGVRMIMTLRGALTSCYGKKMTSLMVRLRSCLKSMHAKFYPLAFFLVALTRREQSRSKSAKVPGMITGNNFQRESVPSFGGQEPTRAELNSALTLGAAAKLTHQKPDLSFSSSSICSLAAPVSKFISGKPILKGPANKMNVGLPVGFCVLCTTSDHSTEDCPEPPPTKIARIRQLNLCHKCLDPGHSVQSCTRSDIICKDCQQEHLDFIFHRPIGWMSTSGSQVRNLTTLSSGLLYA